MLQKNSLVTGGLGGIGQAIVDALRDRGDHVIVFDRVSPNEQSVQDLVSKGVTYIQVDLSSVQSIKDAFSQLPVSYVDLLVNNAGVTRDTLAMRLSENDWDIVLDINLKGAFFCSQQAIKLMIKQPKSYIIFMSSIVGVHGNPGQTNYAASKAGLIALTKSLAKEYAGRNILVNAIAPGFIDTAMTRGLPELIKQKALEYIPLKRFGVPMDVAHTVDFLSSGKADYITGQVIEITGGM